MQTIKVSQVIAPNCLTICDGKKLYDLLYLSLIKSQHIELDFENVGICTAAFFNYSIGQLVGYFSTELLNYHITVVNLAPHNYKLMRTVVANAKTHYQTRD